MVSRGSHLVGRQAPREEEAGIATVRGIVRVAEPVREGGRRYGLAGVVVQGRPQGLGPVEEHLRPGNRWGVVLSSNRKIQPAHITLS